MGLGQRVFVSITRPIYRKLFERPLWWFLAKVKAFFFAETSERLAVLENKLGEIEERLRRIEAANSGQETANAVQWNAIEQLLLSLLRQPAARSMNLDTGCDNSESRPMPDRAELNHLNAPHNIR
jgi:hypothetical protein